MRRVSKRADVTGAWAKRPCPTLPWPAFTPAGTFASACTAEAKSGTGYHHAREIARQRATSARETEGGEGAGSEAMDVGRAAGGAP